MYVPFLLPQHPHKYVLFQLQDYRQECEIGRFGVETLHLQSVERAPLAPSCLGLI